jgi:signal transduction histidine kinase
LEAKAVNELYFANISPGIYKLEVIADEGNIVIGALPAVYKFEILAPFYQTLWFRFLILLLLFLVIYSSFVYVIKRNLKEKILILEKEQALEKERNRISQDMHDDLGSGLTKIAILSEVTKNEIKDPEKAKKHLENISQSSRHLVESLQNIIWILNTSSEGVEDFFSYTHEYALKYLENSNINLIYEIDTSLYKKNNLSQEVRRNIFLVIKEVLNNAVKHADCSEIVFKAKKNFDSLQLTIEDNGKGFNFNQIRKNANGLKSMKDRILKINGTIEYLKNEHQGHKIVIEIPSNFSH